MALTDAQFLAWIQAPDSIRCVLVEAIANVHGAETVRYLSNINYTTEATEYPASTSYRAIISGGVTIKESISIDGTASITYGDIELGNISGELDSWLDDIWTNRNITIFFGDARWARSDFRYVFTGVIAGFGSRDRGVLNIDLRDKTRRLDTPISEVKLGGTTTNKDKLLPICFGECHNIEPLLVDSATLKYQVHNGAIESIIEVRDNGVPIKFVADLTKGTFVLPFQPAGIVTASVQGDKHGGVYRNTVGKLIQHIVTGYGKTEAAFTYSDLDSANFTLFEAANTQPVGHYSVSRINILQVCSEIAASIGAQSIVGRTGLLKLLKIALPAVGTPKAVSASDMVERSLKISDRPEVVASIQIGYCKNWTLQSTLQTGIPEEHKNLFAQEWLTATSTNSGTASNYRLTEIPVQIDTLLLTAFSASFEASRRLNLWGIQRNVYSYTGTASMLLEQVGDAQTIKHARFGLANGITGQIVSVSQNWLDGTVEIEVLA